MNTEKRKKRKRRKNQNQQTNKISDTKLFFIFLGCLFIFFGIFIGDFNCGLFGLPSHLSISIGFIIQLMTIAIFVKQKSIKTDNA